MSRRSFLYGVPRFFSSLFAPNTQASSSSSSMVPAPLSRLSDGALAEAQAERSEDRRRRRIRRGVGEYVGEGEGEGDDIVEEEEDETPEEAEEESEEIVQRHGDGGVREAEGGGQREDGVRRYRQRLDPVSLALAPLAAAVLDFLAVNWLGWARAAPAPAPALAAAVLRPRQQHFPLEHEQ